MDDIGPRSIDQDTNLANKIWLRDTMQRIAGGDDLSSELKLAYGDDGHWRGSHPLNEMDGASAIEESVWRPLHAALPDLERRDCILIGGRYQNRDGNTRDIVATVGQYVGTFKQDWLGIPATGQPLSVRYGEVHEVDGNRIIRSTCLWDILDVMRQAGFWPVAPSRGTEGAWLPPFTNDGIVLSPQDMDEGLASIRQTLAMHKTLANYRDQDGLGRDGLLAMPQKDHWHPKMMWYGPAGIGTTRGLAGFVDFHQLPFRNAFPGRKGGSTLFESSDKRFGHYLQIGDGCYSATGGWPSVVAMHQGGDLFGVGATGKQIEMRVMDFYLHHEGLIRENWVPIDVLHILLQMGVDVMARMHEQFGPNRLGL
ncbi:MAG: hypothetical protein AAGF28_11155 [Pseudomonadota bacterium]